MGIKAVRKMTYIFILLSVWTVAGCSSLRDLIQADPSASAPTAATPAPSAAPTSAPAPEDKEYRLRLAAIGDVLLHGSVWKDAAKEDGGFDFKPMFTEVLPFLQLADITIANQESMMGGSSLGLTDYPSFNSPFEIGDALQDAGVDIVSMANNHTLDRGEKAIRSAIGRYREIGMEYVGSGDSLEDNRRLRVLERNGIRVAFLSYTYGTNGIPVPDGKAYLVNLLDPERIVSDIAEARESADFVAVSMHFGTEYQTEPNAEQRNWTQIAADAGADLVIGHHPHVLQPMEWVVSGAGKRMLAIYSLGNFLAAQEQKSPERQLGGIATLDFVKQEGAAGTATFIENVGFTPTFISFTKWRNFHIYPLDKVTDAMLSDAAEWRKEIENRMTSRMPELTLDYEPRTARTIINT